MNTHYKNSKNQLTRHACMFLVDIQAARASLRSNAPTWREAYRILMRGIGLPGILSALLCNLCLAHPAVNIEHPTLITKPTLYKNTHLTLSEGSFRIEKGGTLDIENSLIDVTLSPSNPYFILLNNGSLILKNNTIHVTANNIIPTPLSQTVYQLIRINAGELNITQNQFSVNQSFSVGLLATQSSSSFNGFTITKNEIWNFHGGFYLAHLTNGELNNNIFHQVSLANILLMGSNTSINHNDFNFPGNLKPGDAIDIINSENITIQNNIITSSANYGIYVLGGQDIVIDSNKITDGLSYGVFIKTATTRNVSLNPLINNFIPSNLRFFPNNNITISNNYLEQNRYGLAGEIVGTLTVKDNIFIQRFPDASTRRFWTDNHILLPKTLHLTWINNTYKEAFSQEVPGNNTLSYQFVEFPAEGGVVLHPTVTNS